EAQLVLGLARRACRSLRPQTGADTHVRESGNLGSVLRFGAGLLGRRTICAWRGSGRKMIASVAMRPGIFSDSRGWHGARNARASAVRMRWVVLLIAGMVGCGDDPVAPLLPPAEPPVLPPPLAALPPPSHAESERFATSSACAQCHLAKEGDDAMRDASGRDVSPVRLWRASMMGLAARDPYYLAVFSHELSEHAVSASLVERTCVRCHAPAGHLDGKNELDFAALTAGDSSVADLGRDGVTCSMCHQIADRDLGKAVSFSGGFEVGYDREIFGPHA